MFGLSRVGGCSSPSPFFRHMPCKAISPLSARSAPPHSLCFRPLFFVTQRKGGGFYVSRGFVYNQAAALLCQIPAGFLAIISQPRVHL